jgi:hypothetical protein
MNEWRLDRNTIQQLRESIAERDPARAGPPSLLVALTPDDQEPSFYRVQAWLWRSKEFIKCIHKDHSDSELYDDKKLGTLLTTLIGQIKTDIADQEPELRIEFFLRIDRLAYPVEKVEIGREYTILGKKRVELWPIAIKYNVVVRSLESIQRDVEGWQELITSWEHKWSMTKNMLRTISAQPAALEYSGSENDLDGEETSMLKLSHADNYESSFLQSRLIMPRTIGFALLEPPGSDNDLRAALEEALIMGIPLGIWLRSGANCPLPSHPDFTALVASKHLGELP